MDLSHLDKFMAVVMNLLSMMLLSTSLGHKGLQNGEEIQV